jgi:hypothetical protein
VTSGAWSSQTGVPRPWLAGDCSSCHTGISAPSSADALSAASATAGGSRRGPTRRRPLRHPSARCRSGLATAQMLAAAAEARLSRTACDSEMRPGFGVSRARCGKRTGCRSSLIRGNIDTCRDLGGSRCPLRSNAFIGEAPMGPLLRPGGGASNREGCASARERCVMSWRTAEGASRGLCSRRDPVGSDRDQTIAPLAGWRRVRRNARSLHSRHSSTAAAMGSFGGGGPARRSR